jgi:hypothetical protein
VYDSTSVDGAIACLSATVHDAVDKSIPYSHAWKSKFPPWFSKALRYYITKKNYYHCRFQKKQTSYYYDKFVFCCKLVKHSIKSDRLRWPEAIDNNLKAQPQHLWNYVYNFRKQTSSPIQLLVDGVYLDEPSAVADTFANHFQSVYNIHCPVESSPLFQSSEVLPLALVSDEDVLKAIKHLKPSKSVGFSGTPGFIIKGCSLHGRKRLLYMCSKAVTMLL